MKVRAEGTTAKYHSWSPRRKKEDEFIKDSCQGLRTHKKADEFVPILSSDPLNPVQKDETRGRWGKERAEERERLRFRVQSLPWTHPSIM